MPCLLSVLQKIAVLNNLSFSKLTHSSNQRRFFRISPVKIIQKKRKKDLYLYNKRSKRFKKRARRLWKEI